MPIALLTLAARFAQNVADPEPPAGKHDGQKLPDETGSRSTACPAVNFWRRLRRQDRQEGGPVPAIPAGGQSKGLTSSRHPATVLQPAEKDRRNEAWN
jgi:hypothetical protein